MLRWQSRFLMDFDLRSMDSATTERPNDFLLDPIGEFYFYVNQGDYSLYGFKQSSENALIQYTKALNFAEEISDKAMICEALKRILDLYRYKYLAEDNQLDHYFELYARVAYDEYETYYLLYFKQMLAFKHYKVQTWDYDLERQFSSFLKGSPYHFLNARIYQLLASYYSFTANSDFAISHELSALKALENVDHSYKRTLMKISHINLIIYYLELNETTKARSLISNFDAVSMNSLEQDFDKYLFYYQSAIDTIENDYKAAFNNLTNYLGVLELNAATRSNDEIKKFAAEYHLERQQQLIKESEIKIKTRNRILGMGLFFTIILLSMTFFLWKISTKLKQKNQRIELLHREIHHRVKNNLQVVSSLMGLQSYQLEDNDAKKAISEGKERIKAMSLIHEKLYQRAEVGDLNFEEYVVELTKDLASSYGFGRKIKYDTQIDVKELDTDRALAVGLILNELVSNAFKHAFTTQKNALIKICFIHSQDRYQLDVSDNGQGCQTDTLEQKSFGMKIVKLLVRQLKGSVTVSNDSGLHYSIVF